VDVCKNGRFCDLLFVFGLLISYGHLCYHLFSKLIPLVSSYSQLKRKKMGHERGRGCRADAIITERKERKKGIKIFLV